MADENDYYTKLLHAEHLGDAFKVLVHMYAIKDKLDLTRIEIPENPWDFESAITRWIRSGECPPDVSETTAAASAALLSYEGAPAHLEILDQPEYGGDRLNIIVQANEGSGVLRVVSALGTHQAWRTLGRGQHPLSILVRAWLAHQPRRDRDVQAEARPTAILPTALNTARRELAGQQLPRTLKGGLMGEIQPPRQVELPGLFDDVQTVVPVLPLTLFDRGRRKETGGRGAPVAQRLFFEALMSVGNVERIPGQTARLTVQLRDMVAWIWPKGWQRGRDLPRLQRALLELDEMRIYYDRRLWRLVGVTALPVEGTRMDDSIVLRVEHLPNSHHGPMINRDGLRHWGLVSAPAWRTYLRLAYLWDDAKGRNKGKRIYATRPEVERRGDDAIVGTDGEPLRKRHGALVTNWSDHRAVRTGRQERNPAADHVPELGPEDLIRLAHQDTIPADASTRRLQLMRARKAIAQLENEGAVTVERRGCGWRILEPRRDTYSPTY